MRIEIEQINGPYRSVIMFQLDHEPELLQGEQLLNIADWLFGGDGLAADNGRVIKSVTRRALQQQLGERSLNSRELLMAFRNGAEPGDLSDGVK